MAQWGKEDVNSNSVLWGTTSVNLPTTAANRNTLYQNTTVGAFNNGGVASKKATGQFGVSAAEAANTTGEGKKVAHAGWNLRTVGTGSLATLVLTAPGKLYSNTDVITINAGTGGTNATAAVATTALGNLVSVSITSVGAGFTTAIPTAITVANSTGGATTGSLATFTSTAGGRAGRVQYETLVAMGSQTNGTEDDAILPQ
jgi:hypothetical protein